MSERVALIAAVVFAAAIRLPFLLHALGTPIDGDTAIVGLMALHPGVGTTLWGQPYGSPLDSWVALPFVAALGPTRLALRLPYFLLSLALVPLASALARRVHPRAGPAAAWLMACPPAYAVLLSVLPPPLYPTSLVLVALALLLALRTDERIAAGGRPLDLAFAWGAVSGLAVWTHLVSLATVVTTGALLARHVRRHPAVVTAGVVALIAASAPWWTRAVADPTALAVLSTAYEGRGTLAHAAEVASRLYHPLIGLLGAFVPLTADEAERVVALPWPVALALIAADAIGIAVAVRRGGLAPLVLGLTAAFVVAAFPFPVRSNVHTLRFLTPALVPLMILVAAGWRVILGARANLVVAAVCLTHAFGALGLFRAWKAAGGAALVPDCRPARHALEQAGVRRAFASYNTAYCITYESGERIIASQPWNERFYGLPLPLLDEVRFAREVAWVLVPGADFDLPAPRHFESRLAALQARYETARAGGAVVYHHFEPPFSPRVRAQAVNGPAGDLDPFTRLLHPPRDGATFPLRTPAPASALTVLAGMDGALPANLTVEVSYDGSTGFERVARRRPGRDVIDLVWVNGHPELATDLTTLTVVLEGRPVHAVRLTPADQSAPWPTAEVLLHDAGDATRWAEDPGLMAAGWGARRRRLAEVPDREHAGWLWRSILAARHDSRGATGTDVAPWAP